MTADRAFFIAILLTLPAGVIIGALYARRGVARMEARQAETDATIEERTL